MADDSINSLNAMAQAKKEYSASDVDTLLQATTPDALDETMKSLLVGMWQGEEALDIIQSLLIRHAQEGRIEMVRHLMCKYISL